MKLPCQTYTSLFDIGRSGIDGRTLDHYKKWLKSTIENFPNLIVYHDGSCDDLIGLDCNFQKVAKDTLRVFSYESAVKSIFEEFQPSSPNDITFKLPQYSLVQFAKFELGSKVIEDFDAQSILWVDAGISRFIKEPLVEDALKKSVDLMFMNEIDAAFEIDLRNNFNLKTWSISNSEIGSCRRVISGTSFWMDSRALGQFNQDVSTELENWLRAKVWDNEQVLLRNLLPSQFKIHYIPQITSETGSVARAFSKGGGRISKFVNARINQCLERGK